MNETEPNFSIGIIIESKTLSLPELTAATKIKVSNGMCFSKGDPKPKWLQGLDPGPVFEITRLQVFNDYSERLKAEQGLPLFLKRRYSSLHNAKQTLGKRIQIRIAIQTFEKKPAYFKVFPVASEMISKLQAVIHIQSL